MSTPDREPDDELPRLGRAPHDESDDGLPRLGSLAQSARIKELNTARSILIVIGILTILVNGFQFSQARDQVHKALQVELTKQGIAGFPPHVQQIEEVALRFTYLVLGAMVGMGVLFVVFGILVKTYPVPITITSLVLYVGAALAFAVMDPKTLAMGAVIKIFIVIALAKAIQSALVYQKEQRLEALGRDE